MDFDAYLPLVYIHVRTYMYVLHIYCNNAYVCKPFSQHPLTFSASSVSCSCSTLWRASTCPWQATCSATQCSRSSSRWRHWWRWLRVTGSDITPQTMYLYSKTVPWTYIKFNQDHRTTKLDRTICTHNLRINTSTSTVRYKLIHLLHLKFADLHLVFVVRLL